MLDLPRVTLCCVDTRNHALALRALSRCRQSVRFGRTLFLTHGLAPSLDVPRDVEVRDIGPIASREAYSTFALKRLVQHVDTEHVLLVQWDGYVINPAAWSDEFLACDYIGAKWFWFDDAMRIGNGGFSLRSRRLLEALQDERILPDDAEDLVIGRSARPLLEAEYGIRYADEALADRFAFEAAYPVGMPFGFHGLFNFCRTVPPEEIAELAATFSDAIACSPQLLQLMRNCAALGQWNAAHAIAGRILRALPDASEPAAMLERARVALAAPRTAGRNEPCPCGSGRKFKHCHGALDQAPSASIASSASAPQDLATVVAQAISEHQQGRLDNAERGYRAVLARAPDHPLATHYLGVIHYQRHDLAQALPLLEAAVRANPAEPEFHNNLGLALAASDRLELAVEAYRRALALRPQHATAWNNLGLALQASNRLAEGVVAFREAIAHAPQFGEAHWNLALALLARGEYEEGWRAYEWRLALAQLGRDSTLGQERRWGGRITPGMTVLLTAEQGLGDALQFVRFAQDLAARGVRVIVQGPKALVALLATAPGVAAVCARGDPLPAFDAHLPLLSIAGALGVTRDTVGRDVPYLRASEALRAQVRTLLPARSSSRIGISWEGSQRPGGMPHRSIAFDALARLIEVPHTTWVSLQKDVSVGAPLLELSERNDFDSTAAIVAELDLVITVDTSIAHLAGALGKPTWIMLPFAADWRWGFEGDTSPWYPTVRLFRQPRPGDWESVVRAIRDALDQRVSRGR